MKRLLLAAIAILVSSPGALALEALKAAERDLWCGLAIAFVVEERPADSAIDTATLEWLTTGSKSLIQRGEAAYLEQGYSEAALSQRREELAHSAATELGTPHKDEPFSYEECRALFGG